MAKELAANMEELATTVNCCNGRVGRRIMELSMQEERFRAFVQPSGVELMIAADKAGLAKGDTINCCNGKVGSRFAMEDLAAEIAGR